MNSLPTPISVRFGIDFVRPPRNTSAVLPARPNTAPVISATEACKGIATGMLIGAGIVGACKLTKSLFKGLFG